MTKKADDGGRASVPGLDRLDVVLKKALSASNKDVQKKMAAEKRARKRVRRVAQTRKPR